MYDVFLRLTNNCNVSCRHCCYECSPGRESMSPKNLDVVLKNLSAKTDILTLTGGEVFTRKNLLFQALENINLPNLVELIVQTNGYWIKDKDDALKMLEKLSSFGVTKLEIASYDNWHKEQGIIANKIVGSYGIIRNGTHNFNNSSINVYSMGVDKPTPVGRAKSLSQKEIVKTSKCFANINTPNISPDGNVSFCCFPDSPIFGSIFEESLDDIIERARENPIYQCLYSKRIANAAKLVGTYDRTKEILYKKNQCFICEEVFSGINLI